MKNFKRILAVMLSVILIVGVFTACSFFNPAAKLIGSWRDSTGTVGYEFMKDNIVGITYADFTVPIINIRYNGTVKGSYTTAKNDQKQNIVTVNYTVLTQTISKSYVYSVNGDTLTLTDTEDGTQTVLMKYTEVAPSVDTSSAEAASASQAE